MAKNSRGKGKVGELEVAKLFKEQGFEARRGQQYSGASGDPDVIVPEELGLHVEVKRTENLSLYTAMQQATDDAREDEDPIVFHRRNSKPWLVIMDAVTFFKLLKEALIDEAPKPAQEVEA